MAPLSNGQLSVPANRDTAVFSPFSNLNLTSLQEQGMEDVYIEILKDIYANSSVTVHLHKESEQIRIKRGVRQGDTISPKLFTATLESIFRRLNWENKGVKIDS